MVLNHFICFVVHCISLLCWAAGKYLLINLKEEENHEANIGESENELDPWKGLDNDETIFLSRGCSEAADCWLHDNVCHTG